MPLLNEFLVLFRMGWRQDVGLVLTPHLSSHNTGIVGAVTNGNDSGVIDQMWYLLAVMLVGWREVDCRQLAFRVHGSMQFEAVMPPLPVLPKGSYAFGYPVAVGSDQFTDMQHGAVHEPERCVFHQQLVKDTQHARQRLVALPDK